jgi:hypothetical protein
MRLSGDTAWAVPGRRNAVVGFDPSRNHMLCLQWLV